MSSPDSVSDSSMLVGVRRQWLTLILSSRTLVVSSIALDSIRFSRLYSHGI